MHNEIDAGRLQRLLAPSSLAVFGTRGADFAIQESQKMGFSGPIYAVHPTRSSLAGLACLKNISDLPTPPDAAYVAVNADSAIDIVAQLNAMGAGGAVLYAAGFGELGDEGMQRQEALIKVAGSMPIIGPNCYGIINVLDKAVLWPDQHGLKPVTQGVAIITQSGNIGLNMTMQKVGLPIAYMMTLGNQAQLDIARLMEAMLDDTRVTAIGLHIEGIKDLLAFDRVARRALRQRIPIVVIKSGRSETAAHIALSHTSSLTGADELCAALFERLGIARVTTVPEFIELLKLLSLKGVITNNQIASMSCSGGEAGMMADLIEDTELVFPHLTDAHAHHIQETLVHYSDKNYVDVHNPLDYHTFIWGNKDAMRATFSAMMSRDALNQDNLGFGACILLLDWPNYPNANPLEWDTALQALAEAAKKNQPPAIVLTSMAECLPTHAIEYCLSNHLVPMIGLDTCLLALDKAYAIGQAFNRPVPAPLHVQYPTSSQANSVVAEYAAKQRLASYGLPIPKSYLVKSLQAAMDASHNMDYPLVAKITGTEHTHKTELNGVRLNIHNQQTLTDACAQLFAISDRLLIETMHTDVLAELIIGVNNDPLFGNYLVIGAGGIMVELWQDSQVVLLPAQAEDIQQALSKLRIRHLWQGFRGGAKADEQAIIKAIMAVINYIQQHPVHELDVNPLLIKADACIAVDALIHE